MIVYDEKKLQKYLEDDWVMKLLMSEEREEDKGVRTHRWIREMDNKRLIFSHVYGDLLRDDKCQVILDVGGAYSSLTRRLLAVNEYHLLDFIAHGGQETIRGVEEAEGKRFWINEDWMEYEISQHPCDIIIANDIFPDVDQRLELFIDRFLPYCKEMRLVLTFYNEPKYYQAKRVDDAEILTFLSWDGEITGMKLKKYKDKLIDTKVEELENLGQIKDSIYWNGRQVVSVRLTGQGSKCAK